MAAANLQCSGIIMCQFGIAERSMPLLFRQEIQEVLRSDEHLLSRHWWLLRRLLHGSFRFPVPPEYIPCSCEIVPCYPEQGIVLYVADFAREYMKAAGRFGQFSRISLLFSLLPGKIRPRRVRHRLCPPPPKSNGIKSFSIGFKYLISLAHPTGVEPVTSAFGGQQTLYIGVHCRSNSYARLL